MICLQSSRTVARHFRYDVRAGNKEDGPMAGQNPTVYRSPLGQSVESVPVRHHARSGLLNLRTWLSFLIAALFVMNASAQQKITINYPNRSGANWPLFLAKEGGYYQKYGLDVTLVFGVMPAGIAMLVSGEAQEVNSSLDQLMQAASKDGSLVLIGSSPNRAAFALMAAKNIGSIKELKGKRIAGSQVGDAPYGYLIALLSKSGMSARDVQWIPV